MALLLETTLGDLTIDLDISNSPTLCRNILKLAKARYYTNTLIYNVQNSRFCQCGDPKGDGYGGACIYGLIDVVTATTPATVNNNSNNINNKNKHNVELSQKRFMKSQGNRILTQEELMEKGRVVMTEMGNVKDTIGSQFLITIDQGENKALHGINHHDSKHENNGENSTKNYYSLGKVAEDDDNVLSQINSLYVDKHGRPYTDVRIIRMHILDDPFYDSDPKGMDELLQHRQITLVKPQDLPSKYQICSHWISCSSPTYDKPSEEIVEERIPYTEAMMGQQQQHQDVKDNKNDQEMERKRHEQSLKKEDQSNAAILEMLGDIASADMKPPENVLFVCKLNPNTDDEDLQLIFSRFDPNAKAEIIRDADTGDSLQYAFVEFDTKEACTEAYFKMNNALVDDRRIKVDFSQSVAKEWNRFTQQRRRGKGGGANDGRYHNNHNNHNNHNQQQQHQYHNRPKNEKKYYGGYRNNQNNQNNHAHTHYGEMDRQMNHTKGDSHHHHSHDKDNKKPSKKKSHKDLRHRHEGDNDDDEDNDRRRGRKEDRRQKSSKRHKRSRSRSSYRDERSKRRHRSTS